MNDFLLSNSIFEQFQNIDEQQIYCKVCSITLEIKGIFLETVHHHLRTLDHQIVIHDGIKKETKKFIDQKGAGENELKSCELFSYKKAHLFQEKVKKDCSLILKGR